MRRTICVLVAAVVLGTASLFAQTTTGTLRGTVRDTSGAVLPGATVEVTGAAGTQTAVADANGQYRFQALTPGVYSLKATLDGFKAIVMDGLRVEVGRTFDVDLPLEVGAVAETITVTGESPLIDTSQSAVTVNYNQELIQDTPVLRFSVFDYFQMTPGDRLDPGAGLHDLLGLRLEHQRKPVPDRWHQHHLADGRADVALSQYRHRRLDGVGWRRRARRIRQHAGRGVQHRHEERRQRDERLAQLVQPVPGHDRQQSA